MNRGLTGCGALATLVSTLGCSDSPRKCNEEADCPTDQICRGPEGRSPEGGGGRCRDLGGEGAACVEVSDCRIGLVCRGVIRNPDGGWEVAGECRPLVPLGGPCDDDGDCQAHLDGHEVDWSAFCTFDAKNPVCRRYGTLEVGATCYCDEECRAGSLCPWEVSGRKRPVCVRADGKPGAACLPDDADTACGPTLLCRSASGFSGFCVPAEESEAP